MPDNTKRIAQELIVNDKVTFIAGFGMTPLALAIAPLATQAKVPQIVMAAGTSIITERSPYIARTSFTLRAVVGDHRRLGGQERHQEGRDASSPTTRPAPTRENSFKPTRSRPAGGEVVEAITRAARQPGLRAVPAARRRRQARRDLRVRAVRRRAASS